MSNLYNQELEERLIESFDEAVFHDNELTDKLAELYLDPPEYMLHCQDGDNSYLDSYLDDIYEEIKEEFYNSEGCPYDIRALAEKRFDIEF